MDRVSGIYKYHSECFVTTIFRVQVIRGHEVQKVKVLNFGIPLQYMLLGLTFAKKKREK